MCRGAVVLFKMVAGLVLALAVPGMAWAAGVVCQTAVFDARGEAHIESDFREWGVACVTFTVPAPRQVSITLGAGEPTFFDVSVEEPNALPGKTLDFAVATKQTRYTFEAKPAQYKVAIGPDWDQAGRPTSKAVEFSLTISLANQAP